MACTFCQDGQCVHGHPVYIKSIERNRQIVARMNAYREAGRPEVAEAFKNQANAYHH